MDRRGGGTAARGRDAGRGGARRAGWRSACGSPASSSAVSGVVGISGAIHDDAARSFAIGFYGGLGEQESVAMAFEQGKAAVHLDGLPDADRPQLKVRDGFDAARLMLAAVPPSVLVDVPCPYPGMRPFAADDASSFHGREAEIAMLAGPEPRRTSMHLPSGVCVAGVALVDGH